MKLSQKQVEIIEKSLYLKGSGIVKLEETNLYDGIKLIVSDCGRGKSTYALSIDEGSLLDDINKNLKRQDIEYMFRGQPYSAVKPCEMLVLSPRKVICQQQLKNADTTVFAETDILEDSENKIKVKTGHSIGKILQSNDEERLEALEKIRVLVLDEIPTFFLETFAEELRMVIDWMKQKKNLIIIGLTATPELLLDYVNEFQFENVCVKLPPKYQAENITVFINGQTLGKYVKDELLPKVNDDNKALVYVQSAKECYKLYKEYPKTAYFISDSYEGFIEDKETKEIINLVDEMKDSGIKEYINQYEKLPENVNILFMNASAREGMNLKDNKIKYIVIVSFDSLTIQQVIGRQRGDLKEITILSGCKCANLIKNEIQKYEELMAKLNEVKDDLVLYGQIIGEYGAKQNDKNVPRFLYKPRNTNKYTFNPCIVPRLKFLRDAETQAKNISYKDFNVSITHDGKQLESAQNYFTKMLGRYSKNKIKIEYQATTATQIKRAKSQGLDRFDEIADEVLGIRLYSEDKKKLIEYLDFRRSRARSASWKTTKQILIDAGYKVEEGQDKKRYSIISK